MIADFPFVIVTLSPAPQVNTKENPPPVEFFIPYTLSLAGSVIVLSCDNVPENSSKNFLVSFPDPTAALL